MYFRNAGKVPKLGRIRRACLLKADVHKWRNLSTTKRKKSTAISPKRTAESTVPFVFTYALSADATTMGRHSGIRVSRPWLPRSMPSSVITKNPSQMLHKVSVDIASGKAGPYLHARSSDGLEPAAHSNAKPTD